ncbi:hypothetical protein BH10PLA2_BH10PLA2_15170 [soil metagenome]
MFFLSDSMSEWTDTQILNRIDIGWMDESTVGVTGKKS